MSCCGREGSWFKNCGGAGNAKRRHTWYEGIQACKARSQSKTAISNQRNGAQQKDVDSPEATDIANYKAVIADPKTFAFTLVNTSTPMSDTTSIVTSSYTPDNVSVTTPSRTLMSNSSTHILMTSSTHTPASTSISTHGCLNLLKITVRINLLFIVIF